MKATALALVVVGCYWIMNGYQTMNQEGSHGILQIALGVAVLPVAKFLWDRDIGPKES